MNLILDPRAFNFLIMCLYVANSIRWGIAGSWGDCLYWLAAFQITAAVTWGYER